MEIGKVLAISDINVRVYLEVENKVKIGDILRIEYKDKQLRLEVVEIENLVATTIPFYSVIGLKKGLPVYLEDKGIEIEYSRQALGRVFNSYGELLDNQAFTTIRKRNVYHDNLSLSSIEVNSDIMWTGIKVIDFFSPIAKGFKMGLLGAVEEVIYNFYQR